MQDRITTAGSQRTLKVTGRGTASVEPDLVVLTFGVAGRDPSYSTAVERLNERVEALRWDLETAGVDRARLKTTRFDVTAETRFDEVKGERVFSHYRASHRMRLELDFDKEILNRVLGQVTQSASEATVRVSFDVSGREALRRMAMRAAVADARDAAQVLTEAAGSKLGEIESIDYSFIEVRTRPFSYHLGEEDAAMMTDFRVPDIEPEALDMEEGVTIVWSIS